VEVWQTSYLRPLRLGEKKEKKERKKEKKERKKEETKAQKYKWSALLHRAAIITKHKLVAFYAL